MIFLPANRYASLDVKQNCVSEEKTMPYWISLLFIIQVTIVYVFASIAKFYPDWLDGTFTRNLLADSTNVIALKKLFLQKLEAQKKRTLRWKPLVIAASLVLIASITFFSLPKATRLFINPVIFPL